MVGLFIYVVTFVIMVFQIRCLNSMGERDETFLTVAKILSFIPFANVMMMFSLFLILSVHFVSKMNSKPFKKINAFLWGK